MGKRRLLAAALALAVTGVHGQEITWRVDFLEISGRSYTFTWGQDPVPPFTRTTLSGLVKGEDRNRDGWLDMSELSELRFGNDGITGNYVTCEAPDDYSNTCSLSHFRFAPDGPLGPVFEMTGQWYQRTWYGGEFNASVQTGEVYRYEFYRQRYGTYYWTEDTTLQVTQVSAVPEPASGLMLVAGLAAVLGARRWRVRPAWS
ncbi:PEP-CTERM sorting domain-containing protein [Massilia consociata]|uniref:PEP-CTERM sorting domain-containing protein n=1 Tax=Massilia consociata TaxID=760117 RepID=A0ABV6FC18_9BURK